MNGSRIRLSRIIAFNWYGFRTIIDVNGLTLLCGETGTGKSALLDLIQFVMTAGSERFNKAAAGDSNARDLRGYCLCDSRTLHKDGRKRYLRRSGATVAALEFTWPSMDGEKPRRETWGIRVEFDSPTANPSFVRFFVRTRIERNDLCDENGDLLTEELFRAHVKQDLEGDAGFTSHRTFQEEMGVGRHLNFDERQMCKTLPKAIAFELASDYQRFIREFILEPSVLDVANARRSLSALREAETRVGQLRDQQSRLERIAQEDATYQSARREESLFAHLRPALDHAEAEEKLVGAEGALTRLRLDHEGNVAALSAAQTAKEKAKRELDAVKLIAGKEDPKLGELDRLKREESELETELRRVEIIAQTMEQFLAERAREWDRWLRHAATLEWEVGVTREDVAVLRGSDKAAALEAVARLSAQFNAEWAATEQRIFPWPEQIKELEVRHVRLERQVDQLKAGRTAPTPLLDALLGEDIAAHTLGRLVEVTPEGVPWWGMIETLLAEDRNAVLLDNSTDFAAARGHWEKLPQAEPLIEADRIPDATPIPNALSSLLEVRHPVARRFLDWRLGRFAAVRETAELEAHANAVSTDGAVRDGAVRRWMSPEKEFTLGQEGLRRLLLARESELIEVSGRLVELRRRNNDIRKWLQNGRDAGLGRNDPAADAREILRLPKLRSDLGSKRSTIELVQTPELAKRLAQMHRLEEILDAAAEKIGGLQTPITEFRVKEQQHLGAVETARRELGAVGISLQASRAKLPTDILDAEIAELLGHALTEKRPWSQRRDLAEAARRKWETAAADAKERRLQERSALIAEQNDEFGDFDALDESNERFDKRLEEIREHEVRRFDALATERRADWEEHLQKDVLNRLSEKLKDAQQVVNDFRRILSQPIGGYRYQLSQTRDPVHRAMWKLITESEEGGLDGLKPGDELMDWKFQAEIDAAKAELMHALDHPDDKRAAALLDYRNYHRYDLDMIPLGFGDNTEGKISLQASGRTGSGGEGQAPFFVAVLAAFHRVYDRGQRDELPSLGLVVMDEAFSKLSAGHIADCLSLADGFGLQLILAFPMDRVGTMVQHADSIIQCRVERRADENGVPAEIINDVVYWDRNLAATLLQG